MAAHQAGFANVVASLGTALTRGQIELATRYADGIALAYDVDLAGEAATQRGLLEELGPDQSVSKVRVVRIPAGKDPDELIRNDPDAWRKAVAEAKPVIEYFMERTADRGRPRQHHRQARAHRARARPAEAGRRPGRAQPLPAAAGPPRQRRGEGPARGAGARAGAPRPAPRPAAGRSGNVRIGRRGARTARARGREPPAPVSRRSTAELPADEPLPFRDAATGALVAAWRERVSPTARAHRGGPRGIRRRASIR